MGEDAQSQPCQKTFRQLVVVGSSAGGIQALSELVEQLPEDYPAPVVIAQHLSPDRRSHLEEILSRKSRLPVRTVTDGTPEPLEAGKIYVVPANWHVQITDSEISLLEDSQERPKPSVDMLMMSAAQVYEERLIAVILTGTGTDGSEGARTVRKYGGTVITQNPDTAEFGGMPGSPAPNIVDIVAELSELGDVLIRLTDPGDGGVPDISDEDEERRLLRFLKTLKERRGVDFTEYKMPTIMRRIKRRMVATKTADMDEYEGFLDANPDEYHKLVQSLLIKVTEFFRDPELFEYLREEILTRLVEDVRGEERQIRIWSAGCATGEEAYSLAMIVCEILGEEANLFNVRIFATDIDSQAIDFARQGLYTASALKGLDEEQIERYFDRDGSRYQVKKSLRSMIVFGEHDLASRSPFPRIDLVVCRNVLIYFTAELQRRALQLFAYALDDGRYLVLGKAETTSLLNQFFVAEDRHHKVFRRQGARFLLPPAITSSSPAPRPGYDATSSVKPMLRDYSAMKTELRRDAPLPDDELLGELPVGVVIVDRQYHIESMNGAARSLLSVHGRTIGEDFLHLLQGAPYSEVRGAIDTAFRSEGDSRTGGVITASLAGSEPRYLQFDCRRRGAEPIGTVVIVISDVSHSARENLRLEKLIEAGEAELEKMRHGAQEESSHLRAQNERLIETNQQLKDANRELVGLNEGLRSVNEELLLSAEEAQASTEEVETLNEELQATNEELETLNEELQATVEELNTTNDDLQARSEELREVARNREEERRKSEAARGTMNTVLLGIPDPVLAVDGEGEVLFANESFELTFGGMYISPETAKEGGIFTQGGEVVADGTDPKRRAAKGESFEEKYLVVDTRGERRGFVVQGRPMRDGEGGGGVIIFNEIDPTPEPSPSS